MKNSKLLWGTFISDVYLMLCSDTLTSIAEGLAVSINAIAFFISTLEKLRKKQVKQKKFAS